MNNKGSTTQGVVAGILAGGHSERMGLPKGLLQLPDGTTLIEHAHRVLQPLVDEVVILGQAIELPGSLQKLQVLADEMEDGGPLAGLCTLLAHADGRWALLIACDMPRLSSAVLERLLDHRTDDANAVVYQDMDQPRIYHACCALYHPAILPQARAALTSGRRSMRQLLDQPNTLSIKPGPQEQLALTNVNTPQEWNALRPD